LVAPAVLPAGAIDGANLGAGKSFYLQRPKPMPQLSPLVGTGSVVENMLKRKWSAAILRYLVQGVTDPADIVRHEPDLSASVMYERLRAMLRYELVGRFPRPAPSKVVEFRPTPRGKKILKMLDVIDRLDQLDQQFILNEALVEADPGVDLTLMAGQAAPARDTRPRRPEPTGKDITRSSRTATLIHSTP
jgi:DNA-binding HxlR family transcriptional regulator